MSILFLWRNFHEILPNLALRVIDPRSGIVHDVPATYELAVVLISLILVFWGFIEMGFVRGTRGENRYGPDPLADRGAPAS